LGREGTGGASEAAGGARPERQGELIERSSRKTVAVVNGEVSSYRRTPHVMVTAVCGAVADQTRSCQSGESVV
jgi:hypothetical protein